MKKKLKDIDLLRSDREVYSIGKDTLERIVSSNNVPAMKRLYLSFVGISEAGRGFAFSRLDPDLSQLLVCCSGKGMIFVDGQWQELLPGMAFVTPRHHPHRYQAIPDESWRCCWATYVDPVEEPPILSLDKPLVISMDPRSLEAAIAGLYSEVTSVSDVAMSERWASLIDAYVRRAIAKMATPDHLWVVWEKVRMNPGHSWTLDELSKLAHVSREGLRQWCHASHGCSPLEYLTLIRMKIAADRLQRSREKIESIAIDLGYANQFAFSRAFKRVMGGSPNQYRTYGFRSGGAGTDDL